MAWDYWAAVFGARDAEDVTREATEARQTVRQYIAESVAMAAEQDHDGTFDPVLAAADIVWRIKSLGLALDQRLWK